MVNLSHVVLVIPQTSVAFHLPRAAPVAPHSSLSIVKSMVMVTVPQKSYAATSDSQTFNSSSFPAPSHSTVMSAGTVVNTGAVLSSIVNVADVVVVLQHSSVAVHVTRADPVSPHPSLSAVKSLVMVKVPQLSDAATSTRQALISSKLHSQSHTTIKS